MSEMQSTIDELEALRDISQELEENQAVVEKQLRSELCKIKWFIICGFTFPYRC
jgi:hypothetical protein